MVKRGEFFQSAIAQLSAEQQTDLAMGWIESALKELHHSFRHVREYRVAEILSAALENASNDPRLLHWSKALAEVLGLYGDCEIHLDFQAKRAIAHLKRAVDNVSSEQFRLGVVRRAVILTQVAIAVRGMEPCPTGVYEWMADSLSEKITAEQRYRQNVEIVAKMPHREEEG